MCTLPWRHNGRDGVSNHRQLDRFLKRLFNHRSKKTSKLHVTGICAGNSPVTGEFATQSASNAENIPFDDIIMNSWNILTRISNNIWFYQISTSSRYHEFSLRYTCMYTESLQWRHNEHDGVSNHRRLHCLLKCLLRHRWMKISKLRVNGHYEGNPPVTGGFPSQRTSNAENASIWCHHHVMTPCALKALWGRLCLVVLWLLFIFPFPPRLLHWLNNRVSAPTKRSERFMERVTVSYSPD